MDDIPLQLFDDWEKAVEFAKVAPWDVPRPIAAAFGVPECTTPISIQVSRFVDGIPHSVVFERFIEDEDDDGDDAEAVHPDPDPAVSV